MPDYVLLPDGVACTLLVCYTALHGLSLVVPLGLFKSLARIRGRPNLTINRTQLCLVGSVNGDHLFVVQR